MQLPDWLARQAQAQPDKTAVIAVDGRWTYLQLHQEASVIAGRLAHLGVGPGDPVAILARNSGHYTLLVFALIRLRAVLVPLNTRLTVPELAWQLDDSGARVLLYDPELATTAQGVCSGKAGLLTIDIRELTAPARQTPSAGCKPQAAGLINLNDTHCIMYTSGTTGRPKGAILTYGNHWWNAVASVLNLGLDHDDRWLACLPLFHIGGLSILFRTVIYGISTVILPRFDPAEVNRSIDEQEVTIVSVVSVMLERMLAERGTRPYPSTLRCILLGGGPASQTLLQACAERNLPVILTYGMTETASQLATLAPADALRKLGSAGRPLLTNEVRIEHDGRPAQPGQVGEIVVRGPSVTPGYHNRPEATAAAIRDGWLYTGDLGYLDSDGYLYVLDRRADLIISGGENVYPAEVESVLMAHPDVTAAGVVGLPDPRWGSVPAAVVTVREGSTITEDELIAYCRQSLAGYKVPVRIHFTKRLPRTAGGKLQRHLLRQFFATQ